MTDVRNKNGKHSRPYRPGEQHAHRAIFLFKLVLLPLGALLCALGIAAGPLGSGFANSVGPYLMLVMAAVLLGVVYFTVRALAAKLKVRHENAVEAVRIQQRYWTDPK